jgi:hypothetical protein
LRLATRKDTGVYVVVECISVEDSPDIYNPTRTHQNQVTEESLEIYVVVVCISVEDSPDIYNPTRTHRNQVMEESLEIYVVVVCISEEDSPDILRIYFSSESSGSTDFGESLSEHICPVSPPREYYVIRRYFLVSPLGQLILVSPRWNIYVR